MLGTRRIYGALALGTAMVVAVNCGDDDAQTPENQGGGGAASSSTTASSSSSSSSSSSGTGGGGGTGGAGGMECPPNKGTAFAISKLMFGDGNSGEWKKLGFDIDGQTWTSGSTDTCIPNSGGSPDIGFPDGDDGIDNSFGHNLLPIIMNQYPAWPSDVNKNIGNGVFNTLLKLSCLPDTGDAAVPTKLFEATSLGAPPKFDGTDLFPIAPEVLADPTDPESSTITFDNATVTGQLFDSGKDQTFILTVPMASSQRSTTLKLTLHGAHVKMKLADDRKSATEGVIGGVLDTEEFITEVKKIGWVFGLCDNPLYDDILLAVRQSSDIMNDGTQDPTQTCNGISIGLGFEMKEALIGVVGPMAVPGQTCP